MAALTLRSFISLSCCFFSRAFCTPYPRGRPVGTYGFVLRSPGGRGGRPRGRPDGAGLALASGSGLGLDVVARGGRPRRPVPGDLVGLGVALPAAAAAADEEDSLAAEPGGRPRLGPLAGVAMSDTTRPSLAAAEVRGARERGIVGGVREEWDLPSIEERRRGRMFGTGCGMWLACRPKM
jgi:hypothetical protein